MLYTCDMNQKSLLTGIGLSEAESAVYVALLKSGKSSIREVATTSGINRGTTYEALKRLAAIGLVGFQTQGKRRKYIAESPQKINELIENMLSQTKRLKREAAKVIPSLMSYDATSPEAPGVRFYEDDDGIALILKDVLQTVSQLPNKR